ncbi:MAG: hypothetical protein JNJ55_14540 [Betaproteobacteria bacterium]|nr:hypothetical protein [Betaproteobacteria bacterium]
MGAQTTALAYVNLIDKKNKLVLSLDPGRAFGLDSETTKQLEAYMDPKLNIAQNYDPMIEQSPDEESVAVHVLSDVDLQMVGGGDNVVCW